MSENPKLILFEGGKERSEECAKIEVEGESLQLESFILAGTTLEDKRVVLTWNSSIDECAGYFLTLQYIMNKKIESIIE